jgi:hypothetical protein
MNIVASASIMFDEASVIQMHKHLNVFVNVSRVANYFLRNFFFVSYILLLCYHNYCLMAYRYTWWTALFALFVLVFPTGNAIAERGFSAMGAAHSKQRSEMGHAQVFAHMVIGFNGPPVKEFERLIEIESRQPNWPLYIHPNNFNV